MQPLLAQPSNSVDKSKALPEPIEITTDRLILSVNPATCRWSASLRGTDMRINEAYFLPGNDPLGWQVSSSVNHHDKNSLGDFTTLTLHGTKPGQLDFEYQISVSHHGNDMLISHGRANNTGNIVELPSIDYFVSHAVQLGGTTDQWRLLGTKSQLHHYYDLDRVSGLITPKSYEVNAVIRHMMTGHSLLVGHITTIKGLSRFEVANGFGGSVPDKMQVRGYCSYKVTIPPGKQFAGEKLLILFSDDPIKAMEHQGDLIALAHDIRLKERRPINLEDKLFVANNFSHYANWMSGGSRENADAFFKSHGLYDFYYGLGGPYRDNWGHYNLGANGTFGPRTDYPASCYIRSGTSSEWYTNPESKRVIDFSNPLTVKHEHDRVFGNIIGHEGETGWLHLDFSHAWDKFPGQFDPYMSALETWHAGAAPWRDVIDQKAPGLRNRACFAPLDHSYGYVDIHRVSADADGGYEEGDGWANWLTESLRGASNRFFYNGRVYWNDCDAFHVFKFSREYGQTGQYNYGQAKVSATFHAIAGNTMCVSEAFDVDGNKLQPYPANRIELMKRVNPPTMDVAYPVDLFIRKPAQVWNMPIERPFGKWNIVAVFNYSSRPKSYEDNWQFAPQLDARKDLRLNPDKEYIVYEFWTRRLIGTFKGTMITRAVQPYDCDVYSVVEKQDRPVLISTSRHVRQMAFDIRELTYDAKRKVLAGRSRAVAGDPYQLRIYIPDGYCASRVELTNGILATMKTEGNLLTVDYTTTSGEDVAWKIFF